MKNRINFTLILISLFFSGFTFQSCNPDPPDPGPTDLGFFALGESKDYVYFKRGTWWIYKNTKTGLLDTIEVFNSVLDTLEKTSKKWHFTNEVFLVDSRSLNTGYYYYFYIRPLSPDVTTVTWACIPNLERREPYEGDIAPFYYPFDRLKNNPHGGYETYCTTIKDTMHVNGKVYSDVAVFYLVNDNSEPIPMKRKAAKYYWARHYGLIQKDLFDGKFRGDTSTLYHSWKLINSFTLQ